MKEKLPYFYPSGGPKVKGMMYSTEARLLEEGSPEGESPAKILISKEEI